MTPEGGISGPRAAHWEGVYAERDPTRVSWYQSHPALSLRLIAETGLEPDAPILDVGAGTSYLVDELLDAGYTRLGVLDVAGHALEQVRARLGPRAREVEWFETDVIDFRPPHPWALWHDRAVLHFLVEEADRKVYRERLLEALSPDGWAVISTFGPEGPTRCSGLECRRYGVSEMRAFLGSGFELETHAVDHHQTPGGATQQFQYALFRRRGLEPGP